MKEDKIVGFISTYVKNLPSPIKDQKEAFINIIEVNEEFRKQGVATRLVNKTEVHFKNTDAVHIRGWSSHDKVAAINLWNKLNYVLCPATTKSSASPEDIPGYFFIKSTK